MNTTARKVVRSLVPVVCPPEAAGLADAIIAHVELSLSVAPALMRRGFDAGMIAYDVGALPRYFRRAHLLSPAKAERYFESWDHGPTPIHVQLATAVNQLMSLACYEQPAMMEAIGYRPVPWIAEVTNKRLTVFADDVRKQQQQILAPDPLRPRAKREVA